MVDSLLSSCRRYFNGGPPAETDFGGDVSVLRSNDHFKGFDCINAFEHISVLCVSSSMEERSTALWCSTQSTVLPSRTSSVTPRPAPPSSLFRGLTASSNLFS